MFMLGDAMSILARSTAIRQLPFRMRRKRLGFSAGRSRPGCSARLGQRAAILISSASSHRRRPTLSIATAHSTSGEVIRRVVEPLLPVETGPDVLDDRIDVFDLFLGRVRVVEPEVAGALRREPEVQADRFRVSDGGSRWVWGSASRRGRRASPCVVVVDDLADEVAVPTASGLVRRAHGAALGPVASSSEPRLAVREGFEPSLGV